MSDINIEERNSKTLQLMFVLVVFVIVVGLIGFNAIAKAPLSKSTQYLYDECSDALSKNDFKDSYCATYIGAFMDGYSIGGYVMVSEIYKNNIQDKIKRPSDCHPTDPDNLEELVKSYISWVDEQLTSTEIQYDVLKTDFSETLGSMITDEMTCLNRKEN